MFFRRILPITNFIIASSALFFQTKVLYPWHIDISKQIDNLEKHKNK